MIDMRSLMKRSLLNNIIQNESPEKSVVKALSTHSEGEHVKSPTRLELMIQYLLWAERVLAITLAILVSLKGVIEILQEIGRIIL